MHRSIVAIVLALSAPAFGQQLLAVDSNRALYSIDPATGAKTQIATISSNAGTTGGLAYNASTDTLWVTSTGNDSLYTVDVATGTATLVGAYGNTSIVMHGLEYDASTGTLYGVSSHNNGLYTIDQTTGVATLIGTSTLTSFTNLAHDSSADVLYATNSGADSFYSIDRATGAATLIGALVGPTNPNGLTYDSAANRILLVCNSTDSLYSIDVTSGAATLIGSNGSGNLLGLVYIAGGAPPVVYCTAGTSTNGCVPAIAASAQPSASAASSCVLSAGGIEGQKSGLFFYGLDNSAFAPLPWGVGSSFLCVKSPTQRTTPQNSAGTLNACDGAFSLDWNLFLAANPSVLGAPFAAGDKLYVQAWYRDPPASKTTNLSDAVELTFVP